ncbi:hypothetical protein ES703_121408 [subsurface metagenome]
MNIKCIGCYDLLREELTLEGKPLVVYNCPRFFPYACAMSGLLRPSTGILKAANRCPDDPLSHCAVCSNTKITHYGQDIVSICKEHDAAWSKWLDMHLDRRAYLRPRSRVIKANWVEVFREFIEGMRRQK